MTLLSGRVALITGAGGGVGRGIALRFAQEGAAVALHCRTRTEAARALAEEIGERAVVLPGADLTVEDQCRGLVARAAEWGGGRLDALVNNAGVQPVQALPEMTAADWRAVVDTNLTSVFSCTRAAAEVMRERGGASLTSPPSRRAGRLPATPTTPPPRPRS